MNAVRHFPVAEQYPSRTASVSLLASNRTSGIPPPKKMPGAGLWPGRAPKPRARREGGEQGRHSGGRLVLRAAALGVQTQQTVAKLPIWNLALAMQQARDMALNSVDRSSDLRLCQAGFH